MANKNEIRSSLFKLIQFKFYSFLSSKFGMALCIIGAFVSFNTIFQLVTVYGNFNNNNHILTNDAMYKSWENNVGGRSYQDLLCSQPIDIVYTWVNGSDPKLSKAVNDLKKSLRDPNMPECKEKQIPEKDNCYRDDNTASRYVDNQELKYSLRSIEKNAPWIRHIYIVTNGQVPNWLDLSNPKVSIITHEDIFQNKSHLPTFSSPSIETHLHRIPGLSKKFLYLNDDVMFGREIYPDDFVTQNGGQKVFLSWPVPNCNDGCPNNWIGDGFCDQACNVSTCEFDAGDCNNSTGQAKTRWWNRPNIGSNTATNQQNQQNNNNNNNNNHGLNTNTNDRLKNYCSRGCPDSWVGDKHCDRMCKNEDCGFDAGDCGVEIMFASMKGYEIDLATMLIELPDKTSSVYFNLSKLIGDGTITDGSHDNAALVRTATISQKHKIMTLTFHKDKPKQNVSISITFETLITSSIESQTEPKETKQSIEKIFNITLSTKEFEEENKNNLIPDQLIPKDNNNNNNTIINNNNSSSNINNNNNNNNNNNDNNNLPDIEQVIPDPLISSRNDFTSSLPTPNPDILEIQNEDGTGLNNNNNNILNSNSGGKKDESKTLAQEYLEQQEELQKQHTDNLNSKGETIRKYDDVDSAYDLANVDEQAEERFNKFVEFMVNKDKKSDRDLLSFSIEIDNSLDDEDNSNNHNQNILDIINNKDKIIESNNNHNSDHSSSSSSHNNNNNNNNHNYNFNNININQLNDIELKIQEFKDKEDYSLYLEYLNILKRKILDLKEYNDQLNQQSEIEKKYKLNKESESLLRDEGEIYPWEEFSIDNQDNQHRGQRKLKDMFGDSLKYVNRLYTKEFGSSPRKVPAHMPHMIDVDVMNEIQAKWPTQWEATSSHSLRHPQDMQYAFSFFYYMIHKKITVDFDKLWYTEWDGNRDGYLNDNELRTLSVNVYGVPIKASQFAQIKDHFYQICMEYNLLKRFENGDQDASLLLHKNHTLTPLDEREDCKITLDVIKSDNKTMDDIKKAYSKRNYYKTTIDGTDEVAFLMIDNNDTVAQSKLDGVRQKRHKFICLNDNINHTNPNTKNVVKVLHDFYDSLFPLPSSFELPQGEQNKYLYIDEFKKEKIQVKSKSYSSYYLIISVSIIIVFILLKCNVSKSFHKSKSSNSRKSFLPLDSKSTYHV